MPVGISLCLLVSHGNSKASWCHFLLSLMVALVPVCALWMPMGASWCVQVPVSISWCLLVSIEYSDASWWPFGDPSWRLLLPLHALWMHIGASWCLLVNVDTYSRLLV